MAIPLDDDVGKLARKRVESKFEKIWPEFRDKVFKDMPWRAEEYKETFLAIYTSGYLDGLIAIEARLSRLLDNKPTEKENPIE